MTQPVRSARAVLRAPSDSAGQRTFRPAIVGVAVQAWILVVGLSSATVIHILMPFSRTGFTVFASAVIVLLAVSSVPHRRVQMPVRLVLPMIVMFLPIIVHHLFWLFNVSLIGASIKPALGSLAILVSFVPALLFVGQVPSDRLAAIRLLLRPLIWYALISSVFAIVAWALITFQLVEPARWPLPDWLRELDPKIDRKDLKGLGGTSLYSMPYYLGFVLSGAPLQLGSLALIRVSSFSYEVSVASQIVILAMLLAPYGLTERERWVGRLLKWAGSFFIIISGSLTGWIFLPGVLLTYRNEHSLRPRRLLLAVYSGFLAVLLWSITALDSAGFKPDTLLFDKVLRVTPAVISSRLNALDVTTDGPLLVALIGQWYSVFISLIIIGLFGAVIFFRTSSESRAGLALLFIALWLVRGHTALLSFPLLYYVITMCLFVVTNSVGIRISNGRVGFGRRPSTPKIP